MKIRLDYVTNSSSSSYIVALKDHVFDEETLAKYPFLEFYQNPLENFLERNNSYSETELSNVIKNKDELSTWIKNDYSYYEVKEVIEFYEKCLKFIEQGYSIYDLRVDYSDDFIEDFIQRSSNSNPNFIIIESE